MCTSERDFIQRGARQTADKGHGEGDGGKGVPGRENVLAVDKGRPEARGKVAGGIERIARVEAEAQSDERDNASHKGRQQAVRRPVRVPQVRQRKDTERQDPGRHELTKNTLCT